MGNREEGLGNLLLFYDSPKDLFRFLGGTFAFSRELAHVEGERLLQRVRV